MIIPGFVRVAHPHPACRHPSPQGGGSPWPCRPARWSSPKADRAAKVSLPLEGREQGWGWATRTKLAFLLVILTLFALLTPAYAERLVAALSNTTVSITSSFAGETLTLFGTIEPDPDTPADPAPYHVVVTVAGPATDRVARRKTNQFGIWINTEQVVFDGFPSYFQVLSDSRLAGITDPGTLDIERITPLSRATIAEGEGWWDSTVFGNELVRLMTEEGLFGVNEQGVQFLSPRFYSARLALPSNVPNGSFLATTYVFQNGVEVARGSQRFTVRKTGFERFLTEASQQQPLLYGLTCVVLALFTGWLGGAVFRR
jgi:uncharacterized protein (TIGR02186 family)